MKKFCNSCKYSLFNLIFTEPPHRYREDRVAQGVDDAPEKVLADANLVAAQVPLQTAFRNPQMAHDPRVVRLSMQGNSIRVVARSHEDIGSWTRDLAAQGIASGEPTDIDVGLEDVFFYLTLQQQGSVTQF